MIMSLFKCRECWLTQCGSEETFEDAAFLMTSLTTEYDLLIVGSHEGVLQIYSPTMDRQEDGLFDGYKPTDLLIEKQLPEPILQIARGRFVSGNQVYHLAILHPRSLAVYSLIFRSGITEYGQQNSLILVYEHQLKRSAYNMTAGAFGGAQTRDFICVQSLDGQLSFYEQENFSFCCFLPEFLLPGQLAYVAVTDSFVTCSSSWSVDSYRYKRLSEMGHTDSCETGGATYKADWTYILGEDCSQMQVERLNVTEMCIVVLAQRSIHCMTQHGHLVFMKRFEFTPICFHAYFLGTINKLMLLVISETSTLLIYENTTLRWSAHGCVEDCVSIRRGEVRGIRGCVAQLSSSGALRLCYLGTEPQLFAAPPLRNTDLQFEKVEEELATLGKIIKNSRNNDVAITNATTERELVVSVAVNPHLTLCPSKLSTYPDQQMALLNIDILPNAPFTEAQVCVVVQPPLKAYPEVTCLENLEQREHLVIRILEDTSQPTHAQSVCCAVIVSHVTRLGVPRVVVKEANLPMRLLLGTCEPIKEARVKITLEVSQQAPALSSLFPEFIGEPPFTQSSTAISLTRLNNQVFSPVTILLAKTTSRYRIQSDSLASISLVAQKLVQRLWKHFHDTQGFQVTTNVSAIGQEVGDIVEKHFDTYQKVCQLQTSMNELSTQYRMIEKRLIGKLKERTPTSLQSLERLLAATHGETIDCAEQLTQACSALRQIEIELGAVLRLVVLLVGCGDASKKVVNGVASIFVSPVFSTIEQSWEEIAESNITHILHTILSKNDKDATKSQGEALDGKTTVDVNKLKKHLLQLFDRIGKDSTRIGQDQDSNDTELLESQAEDEPKEQIGSEIAKNTVRAKSAHVSNKPKLIKIQDDNEDVIEPIEKLV